MNHTISLTLRPDSSETLRLRRSEKLTGLPLALGLLLLLTASCGDLQDPASGPTTRIAAGPATQMPGFTQAAPTPASEVTDPAPMPGAVPTESGSTSTDPAPAPFQNTPGMYEPAGNLPSSQPALPVNTPPAEGTGNPPPWQTRETPGVTTVTLSWDLPPSGTVDGYKVYITSDATASPYYLDAGPETHLAISLLTGYRYIFTVVAYNTAGESLPTSPVSLDLL